MKPKRIILIRHGESEGNVSREVYGRKPDYALELSEKGKAQAKDAGKRLKQLTKNETLFFYVSPLWRTRMTFEELAKAQAEPVRWIEEPRIREQEWGHLRSMKECSIVDAERDTYGTFYYRIPDGESAADVYDRVSDFMGTLHRDFEKQTCADNVALITHGMTIRLFLMRWLHWTVEEFEQIANPPNCSMAILEIDEKGKYQLTTELKRHTVAHSFQRPIVSDSLRCAGYFGKSF